MMDCNLIFLGNLFQVVEFLDLITPSHFLQYFVPLVHEVLRVEKKYDDSLIILRIIITERYLDWKILIEAFLSFFDEDSHVLAYEVHILVFSTVFVRVDVQLTVVEHNKTWFEVALV